MFILDHFVIRHFSLFSIHAWNIRSENVNEGWRENDLKKGRTKMSNLQGSRGIELKGLSENVHFYDFCKRVKWGCGTRGVVRASSLFNNNSKLNRMERDKSETSTWIGLLSATDPGFPLASQICQTCCEI